MTNGTASILFSIASAAGFTASAMIPQGPADAIPWKEIAGGSAALMLLVALWMFLRFLREERAERIKERSDEREKDRAHARELAAAYAASTERITGTVAQVARELGQMVKEALAAFREENQLARRETHDLVRELKRTP